MIPYFGSNRKVAVVREISKKFESNFRGNLQAACEFFEENPPKGEFVIVVEGLKRK